MKIIPLNNDKYSLVDADDFKQLSKYKWHVNSNGYCTGFINGKNIRMHRYILNISNPKVMIDHANGDKLDNRKSNLRFCSAKENSRNVKKHKGISRYKGVFPDIKTGKWRVAIKENDKVEYFGHYDDEVFAAKVYDRLAINMHGDFASINFQESMYDNKPITTNNRNHKWDFTPKKRTADQGESKCLKCGIKRIFKSGVPTFSIGDDNYYNIAPLCQIII